MVVRLGVAGRVGGARAVFRPARRDPGQSSWPTERGLAFAPKHALGFRTRGRCSERPHESPLRIALHLRLGLVKGSLNKDYA
jgi:hypothetical protein